MPNKDFEVTDETSPEQIDSHVNEVMSLPKGQQEDFHHSLRDIAQSGKTSPQTLSAVHKFSLENLKNRRGSGASNYTDILSNLAANPNTPTHNWNGYLNTDLPGNHDSIKESLLKVPGINQDDIKKYIESNVNENRTELYSPHIDQKYYLDLYDKLTEGGTKRLGWTQERNLGDTLSQIHYKPENIEKAKNIFLKLKQNCREFVKNNPDLDSAYLENLHEKSGDGGVLSHRNVSPQYLASIANNNNMDREDRGLALEHPALPEETRQLHYQKLKSKLEEPGERLHWDEHYLNRVLNNPNTSDEEINALGRLGHSAALETGRASDDTMKQAWDKTDKKTDAARKFLTYKKLPESVLTDLVKHSNHEVAVRAVNHDSITENALNIAAKRRVESVSKAASSHPLIADKAIKTGLVTGKISPSSIWNDTAVKSKFNSYPDQDKKAIMKSISDRYKGKPTEEKLKATKEDEGDFLSQKALLATSPHVSDEDKTVHAKEVVDHIGNKINPVSIARHDSDELRPLSILLSNNNPAAVDLLTRTPALLTNINFEKVQHHDVLDKALNSLAEKHDLSVTNDYGQQQIFKATDRYRRAVNDIAENPNLSKESLNKILDNDTLIKSTNQDGNCIKKRFEKRDDYSEQEKLDLCNKYLQKVNTPADAAENILSSKLGSDTWAAVFSGLHPDTAIQVLKPEYSYNGDPRGTLAEHAPTHILKQAIFHQLPNVPTEYDDASKVSDFATACLDLSNPEHRAIFSDLANIQSHPNGDNLHVESLYTALRNENVPTEYKDQLIEKAKDPQTNNEFKQLLPHLVAQKIYDENTASNGDLGPDPQSIVDTINSHADQYQGGLLNGTQERLENGELNRISFWKDLIKNPRRNPGENETAKLLDNLKSEKALDFLADFQGPEGEDLRDIALKKDLFSPEKQSQLLMQGQNLKESLQRMPTHAVDKIFKTSIATPETLTANHVDAFLPYATAPKFTQNGWKANDPTEVEERLKKTIPWINAVIKHSIDDAGDAIQKAILENRPNSQTKKTSKELFSKIISSIQESNLSPQQKNAILLSCYTKSGLKDLTTPSFLTKISKNAVETNDIKTLLNLSELPNPPAVASKALIKASKDPNALTFEQHRDLLDLAKNSNVSLRDCKTLFEGFSARAQVEVQNYPDAQRGVAIDAFNEDISKAAYTAISHTEDEAKSKYFIGKLKEGSLSGSKSATAYLIRSIPQSPDKEDLFKFIPDQITDIAAYDNKVGSAINSIEFDGETLNKSDIIETAQSGWKLQALLSSKNVTKINNKNLDILTDRMVDGYTKNPDSSNAYINNVVNIMRKPGISSEILKKITRAVSVADRLYLANYLKDAPVMPMHELASQLLSDYDNEKAKPDSDKTLRHGHLAAIRDIIAKDTAKEDPNFAEKQEAFHSYIDKVAEEAEQINDMPDTRNKFLLDHIKALTAAKIEHTKDSANKLLDLIDKTTGIGYYVIQNWAANASDQFSVEDWKNAAIKMPNINLYLAERPGHIDSDFLGHYIESMFKENTWATEIDFPDHPAQSTIANSLTDIIPKLTESAVNDHHKKILKYCTDLQSKSEQLIENIIKRMPHHIDNTTLEQLLDAGETANLTSNLYKTAISSGAGGDPAKLKFLTLLENTSPDDISKGNFDDCINAVLGSNKISKDVEDQLSHIIANHPHGKHAIGAIAKNYNAPEGFVNSIAKNIIEKIKSDARSMSGTEDKAATDLLKNPNISKENFDELHKLTEQYFGKMMFRSGREFNPAFLNPRHGVDLLTKSERSLPENIENVKADDLVTEAFGSISQSLQKERSQLEEAISLVPAEGISWADFKKANPKYDQIQAVKKVFNGGKATHKDFLNKIKEIDSEKNKQAFQITYSEWEGAQTHNRTPSLVFQVNSSEKVNQELSSVPKALALYQMMCKVANNINSNHGGSHPVGPHTIGWSRVDTAEGKDGWIIEEFQADLLQKMRYKLRDILTKNPGSFELEGQTLKPEEIGSVSPREVVRYKKDIDKKTGQPKLDEKGQPVMIPITKRTQELKSDLIKHIEKAVEGWSTACLESIVKMAMKNGVSKIYMHGSGIRSDMSGGDSFGSYGADYMNPKIMEIYDKFPEKMGFKKIDYSEYPRHNKSLLKSTKDSGMPTHCWAIDVNELAKKLGIT